MDLVLVFVRRLLVIWICCFDLFLIGFIILFKFVLSKGGVVVCG